MVREGKPAGEARGRPSAPKSDDELRLIRAKADKAELEVEERRGDLIRLSLVKEHYAETAQAVKERLSKLPQVCARRCAQLRDPVEIERILQEEVNAALSELSRGRAVFVKGGDDEREGKPLHARNKFTESGRRIPDDDDDFSPYSGDRDDDEFNPYGDED